MEDLLHQSRSIFNILSFLKFPFLYFSLLFFPYFILLFFFTGLFHLTFIKYEKDKIFVKEEDIQKI